MKDKFDKIVVLEKLVITDDGLGQLKQFANQIDIYNDSPQSEKDILDRIGNADCVLTNYTTQITKSILNRTGIKYIGHSCSFNPFNENWQYLKANEEIKASWLSNYGDESTVEGIIGQLINLTHGLVKAQWKPKVQELNSLRIGILGLGVTGQMTAEALKYFGADIYYNSRTRKPDAEEAGIKYLPLDSLLKTVDVLSIHLPRNMVLLSDKEFKLFGNGKIIISISLGRTYEIPAMMEWLNNENNYFIADLAGKTADNTEVLNHKNTIFTNKHFGLSQQTDIRATKQIIAGIREYFNRVKSL